jgi:LacI family transcriptional regulator
VGLMVSAVENGATPVPGQHFLRPDLYLPESV